MRFLLDTNVLSELRKHGAGRADPSVVRWAGRRDVNDMYLSVLTVQEIAFGVRRLDRRDPRQAGVLRSWLHGDILVTYVGRILPVDTEIALEAARVLADASTSLGDAFIAATALVHRLTVATRNTAHFERVRSLAIVNPWEYAG